MVERFFALITQRAIRRGSFDSTADLVKKIDHFIRTHNANSCPFVWTATANAILQKPALSANFRRRTLGAKYKTFAELFGGITDRPFGLDRQRPSPISVEPRIRNPL